MKLEGQELTQAATIWLTSVQEYIQIAVSNVLDTTLILQLSMRADKAINFIE